MRNILPICLCLAACTPSVTTEGAAAPIDPASPDARAAAASIDAFAADLHAALPKDRNLFYSPTSIALALAVTEQGAHGATKDEMDKVLHATSSAPTYAALMARFTTSKSPEVAIANRVYTDGSLAIEPAFARAAPMESVDFVHDADGARGKINAWVSDRTRTLIPQLIAPGVLDSDARLVIVNAIYFKGAWATAFDPKQTRDETFHGATDSQTAMMHARLAASLGSHAGAQVLDLPYRQKDGPEMSMTIVLPESGHTLGEVESAYEHEGIAPFASAASPAHEIDVTMPKMKMSVDLELANVLGAMGMPTAFTNQADLTGITHTEALKIAKVIHKAYVDVNEEGTTAAAATGVVVEATAVAMPMSFRADHPFLFFVRDRATGVVLFAGRFVSPA